MPQSSNDYSTIGCGSLVAIALLVGVFACSGDSDEPEVPKTLAQLEAKLGPDAVFPMTAGEFKTSYRKLGKAKFAKANAYMRWAGIAAAESPACDKVDDIGVSDHATRAELQWYVHCLNGGSFQVREAQAEAAKGKYDPAATPQERAKARGLETARPSSARWQDF